MLWIYCNAKQNSPWRFVQEQIVMKFIVNDQHEICMRDEQEKIHVKIAISY